MKHIFFIALSFSLASTHFLVALEEAANPATEVIAAAEQPMSTDHVKAAIEEIDDQKNLAPKADKRDNVAIGYDALQRNTATSAPELSWSGWFASWIFSNNGK